jgi:hypothetical protein
MVNQLSQLVFSGKLDVYKGFWAQKLGILGCFREKKGIQVNFFLTYEK